MKTPDFTHDVRRQGNGSRPFRLLAVALVALLVLAGCARGATPTATRGPIAATPGLPPPPAGDERKVDPILLDVLRTYQQSGPAAAEALARDSGVLTDDNTVRLTLVLTGTDSAPVADKVRALGGTVTGTAGNIVEIEVPLAAFTSYAASDGKNMMQDLASFAAVREIRVTQPMREHGLGLPPALTHDETRAALAVVVSEGVRASGADGWHAAGITGRGVRIGIVDVGFGGYETLLGAELPPAERVTTRSFTRDGRLGTDIHGTAVAEIVHAMAPEAELVLARIDTPVTTDRAVRWLVDEVGVDLISMSIGRAGLERQDGTSLGARAVDYAHSRGVLCVVSAGNSADEHYAAPFTDSDGDGYHEFAPGKQELTVTALSTSASFILNWDAWSGPAVNLDLEVYSADGTLLRASNSVQTTGGRDPVETITLPARRGLGFLVRIKGVGSPPAVPLQIFTPAGTPGIVTPEGSLATPADASGAFTVAAIRWDTDRLEDYSSRGPRIDGVPKPDIAGQSVVSSASYGRRTPPVKFNGTSAAAPHVSGAAALFLSANADAGPVEIREFLQGRAGDLEEPGRDNKTGFGRLQLGAPVPVVAARGTPRPAPSPRATATARATIPPATRAATAARTPAPATATRTPALPPQPTVAGTPGAAFGDPFTAPTTGLPNGGEARYDAGRYTIAPSGANRAAWAVYGLHFTDATIEVAVQFPANAPGAVPTAAGIVFWQVSPDDYHLFAVSADGSYTLVRFVRGEWFPLIPWTAGAGVTADGAQALRVTTAGARITVAAGGRTLGTATAAGPGGGRVGMLVASFGLPGASASFDEFRVTPGP